MCSYRTELNVDNKMCPDCFKIRRVGWVLVQSLFDSIHVDTIHIYLIYRYAWWYMYIYRSRWCASPACQWSTGLFESQLALPWMVIMQAYFKPFLFALIFELLRMILEVSPVWQNLGHAEEWWGCKGFRRSTFSAVCHWDLHMRSNEHKPRNILYT